MSIILNSNVLTKCVTDTVLAASPNPVQNSVLYTYLENNTTLTTTSKSVVGAINELKLNKVGRFTTMPTAASTYADGQIYQYIGPKTADYDHGTFYECKEDTTVVPYTYAWEKASVGSTITVDDTLSDTSVNPVQNKVLKAALDQKAKVSVSATGTATDEIVYITVDDVEKKIRAGVPVTQTMPPADALDGLTVDYDGTSTSTYTKGKLYTQLGGVKYYEVKTTNPAPIFTVPDTLYTTAMPGTGVEGAITGYTDSGCTTASGFVVSQSLIYKDETSHRIAAQVDSIQKIDTRAWTDVYKADFDKKVGRLASMPTPSAAYAASGEIYQYTGATTTTAPIYTNGYFYKCIQDTTTSPSTYEWKAVKFQGNVIYSETEPLDAVEGDLWAFDDGDEYEVLKKTGGTMTGDLIFKNGKTNEDYLPLEGGTMTGTIIEKDNTVIAKREIDTSFNEIWGGTNWDAGGVLKLYGKSATSTKGWFELWAANGSSIRSLKGTPDGNLTWDGNRVLTYADINWIDGGITLYSGVSGFYCCHNAFALMIWAVDAVCPNASGTQLEFANVTGAIPSGKKIANEVRSPIVSNTGATGSIWVGINGTCHVWSTTANLSQLQWYIIVPLKNS